MRESSSSKNKLQIRWLRIWSEHVKLLVSPLNFVFCPSPNAGLLGININPQPGLIKWESGQGNIDQVCHHVTDFYLKDA
jgi:hypothetical protein